MKEEEQSKKKEKEALINDLVGTFSLVLFRLLVAQWLVHVTLSSISIAGENTSIYQKLQISSMPLVPLLYYRDMDLLVPLAKEITLYNMQIELFVTCYNLV